MLAAAIEAGEQRINVQRNSHTLLASASEEYFGRVNQDHIPGII
jgi:hypothetical protein